MIRKVQLIAIIIACSMSNIFGQEIPISTWRSHLSFRSNNSITERNDQILVGSEQALFTIDKDDNSISRISKINGLSDVGVEITRYNPSLDLTLVVYTNSNIDILSNDEVNNIGDIKRSTQQGDRLIYDIQFSNSVAYLSSGFGIVVIDLLKSEIMDTYQLGLDGPLRVNRTIIWNDNLVAATENGIYYAPLNSPNLSDFGFWTLLEAPVAVVDEEANEVTVFDGILTADYEDTMYRYVNEQWSFLHVESGWENVRISQEDDILVQLQFKPSSFNSRIITWDANLFPTILRNDDVRIITDYTLDVGNTFWLSSTEGVFKVISPDNYEQILPNGPYNKDVYKLVGERDEIYMAAGAPSNFWSYTFNTSGFGYYKDYEWQNFHRSQYIQLDTILDFVDIVKDPITGHLFYTSHSYIGGVIEVDMESNTIVNWYNQHNSTLSEFPGDVGSVRISGADKDQNGNLWFSNYNGTPSIHVRKTDGIWRGFTPTVGGSSSKQLGDILVDRNGYIWGFVATVAGSEPGKKLVAFDPGSDIDNLSDDRYAVVKTNEGGLNNTNGRIFCMTEDKDGVIWLGTEEGIVVFYCTAQVFDGNCNPSTIIVETDGIPGVLFGEEPVNSIAVDAANRKWVGTSNGAWLLSEDGKEVIYNFTEDNSPLFSNDVLTIAINEVNGEVFFGTERGIISFRSTAIEGGEVHNNVQVFPNPVSADFAGDVAIRGLVNNANVKITDVNGYLVHESQALGGQVVWNRVNYNGDKAASGVYLVFSTDDLGFETFVTKFLIIN